VAVIQQLTAFNDVLYQSCPMNRRQEWTLAVETEALATAILDQGIEGGQNLQKAAAGYCKPAPSAGTAGQNRERMLLMVDTAVNEPALLIELAMSVD
jgi:hypothetical protein